MPRPRLNPAAAKAPCERVLRDREHPRGGRRRLGPVGMRAAERCGEHLGGQVSRELGVAGAANEIPKDRSLVAVVEDRERVGLLLCCRE